jgi:hypothetical protein
MSTLDLFLPLAKVDLDRRIVHGIVTAETPDRVGEICDYDSTKPYFETWSAEAQAASGGKSLGAVRAMHGRIAAGKLTDISFDDEGKRILVAAKIVDDDEWRKVSEGVYTGFSQGGRYVKRWSDPESGLTRYTAEPSEISLVDLPCLPDATFEVVKDGVVEKRAFSKRAGASDPELNADLDADDDRAADKREVSSAQRERDAEAGVAMPDGSYPIRTAKDVENAVRDYRRFGDKPEVKTHIIRRARAIGAESALPNGWLESADKAAAISSPLGALHAPEALAKAAAALSQAADKLERAVEENTRLRKTLADIEPVVLKLEKRLAAIEAQPYPAKAALRALPRSADFAAEDSPGGIESAIKRLSSLPDEERALALMKVSLANPVKRL